jgi:exopolyphosphatase/guanosine-5'-triphosphate,3'-diphosphate pyrophosphatase
LENRPFVIRSRAALALSISAMANNRFAAIDVGSQAVRLKIVRRARGGRMERVDRRRVPLRSGDGVFGGGAIAGRAADRMVEALGRCAEDCARHRATVRAVATSSLREASNRAEVLALIERETGLTLEVISGREEARLVCLGVLEGKAPQVTSLCVDLGGGSVEVALARGEHPVALHSVAAGALRLARELGAPAGASELRARAAASVAELPLGLAERTGGIALGSSGTIRALVEFVTGDTRRYARRDELTGAVDALAEMSVTERCRRFGEHRGEVIAAGAAVLEATLERLGVRVVEATKRGLRDGVLVDLARRDQRPSREAHTAETAASAARH